MATIPKTSVALLNAIATSNDSPRWHEFYDRYQPLLAAWLSGKFKRSLNASDMEDVIQDTMIAFMRKAPDYRYDPKVKGAFHCYLLMIANNKALSLLRSRTRKPMIAVGHGEDLDNIDDKEMLPGSQYTDDDKELEEIANKEMLPRSQYTEDDEGLKEIAKVAIHQVLNNKSTSIRDREVFTRTTSGESPKEVAKAFGITRNNVDQIKNRLMKRIREFAEKLNRAN